MAATTADRAELLRELLRRNGTAWLTCAGVSMEPTIRRGDRLLVEPGPARAGDVVVLDAGDALVTHRVLARLPGLLVHAGDARPELCDVVKARRVVARVALARRAPTAASSLVSLARAFWRRAVRQVR